MAYSDVGDAISPSAQPVELQHSGEGREAEALLAALVAFSRDANDLLAAAVRKHPKRFAGFASLPTGAPEAAADELTRCVRELGFKGAMIMGLTHGRFMDDRQFRPIFERAAALDVPDSGMRIVGLVSAVVGVLIVWLVRH